MSVRFMQLACETVQATAATQVRVRLDKDVVEEYAANMLDGVDFPAIDVFTEDDHVFVLADGFHRLVAAATAKKKYIQANVYDGSLRDALIFALNANAEHGLRRTNADKRNAVELALKDPELGGLRPQEIADLCRVTRRTVEKIMREQELQSANGSQNKNDSQVGNGSEPKEPDEDDIRPSKPAPTQAEVELEEVRQACKLIMALPYAGYDARLEFSPDDVADLEYVSTWTGEVVIAMRGKT